MGNRTLSLTILLINFIHDNIFYHLQGGKEYHFFFKINSIIRYADIEVPGRNNFDSPYKLFVIFDEIKLHLKKTQGIQSVNSVLL